MFTFYMYFQQISLCLSVCLSVSVCLSLSLSLYQEGALTRFNVKSVKEAFPKITQTA